jgi:LmbE family N-acetylglucosaminyl deacetylase
MKNIVGFAAHPDDLEFACNGTLYKFIRKGYSVTYVIITNGENGFKAGKADSEERIKIRKKEQQAAAEKLGVKEVIFLDYKDGFLEYTEELRSKLVTILKTYKPEIIFTFDPSNQEFDNINLFHRDHRITAQAVFDACFAAKNFWMYPDEPYMVETIYFFGTHKPNHFEDITDLFDFKLECLACHKSQFPDFSKVKEFIKSEICCLSDKYKYSEGFRIFNIKQIT